jgi:hypothetical protein
MPKSVVRDTIVEDGKSGQSTLRTPSQKVAHYMHLAERLQLIVLHSLTEMTEKDTCLVGSELRRTVADRLRQLAA